LPRSLASDPSASTRHIRTCPSRQVRVRVCESAASAGLHVDGTDCSQRISVRHGRRSPSRMKASDGETRTETLVEFALSPFLSTVAPTGCPSGSVQARPHRNHRPARCPSFPAAGHLQPRLRLRAPARPCCETLQGVWVSMGASACKRSGAGAEELQSAAWRTQSAPGPLPGPPRDRARGRAPIVKSPGSRDSASRYASGASVCGVTAVESGTVIDRRLFAPAEASPARMSGVLGASASPGTGLVAIAYEPKKNLRKKTLRKKLYERPLDRRRRDGEMRENVRGRGWGGDPAASALRGVP